MKRTILSLSLVVFAFSPAIYANNMEEVKDKVHKISHKLDLTTEQKAQIKVINHEAIVKIKPLRQDMHEENLKMRDLIAEGKANDLDVDRYVHHEKELFGEILKIRTHERIDISKLLSPEQKTKWQKMIEKWKMQHKKAHAKMMQVQAAQ